MAGVGGEGTTGPIPMRGAPIRDSPDSNRPEKITETDSEFLGRLQQITRAGNDWRPYLLQFQATPTAVVQTKCLEVFGQIQSRVQEYMDEAKSLVNADPALLRWWGDVLTHIEDQWEILKSEVLSLSTSNETDDGTNAKRWIALIDDAGYSAARLTIPIRLNDTLKSVPVADSVNFDDLFKDEIPDAAYRKEFVQELYDQILLVEGYVDTTNDTITRIITSGARLWRPIIVAVALIAACVAALYGFLRWSGAPGLPPVGKRLSTAALLSDIGLIWAGMIAHIAISWYKGFRQNGAQVPRSATRILYLISAREMAIWVAILVGAALGYALVLTGHIAQAGPIFAIGYSMDSLVDALVPRFNTSLLQIAKALPAA